MLNIIKASAGSGKTYRLTEEYIRLLFENHDNYRHVLAVTFTNKATEEMKSRIITELDHLASGRPSGYLHELMHGHTEKSEEAVRNEARFLLITILHDYSVFSISTIDRFFQQTIRAFTREIGLQGNYNIELDVTDVLEQTIDRFLFDLDDEQDQTLLDWLIRFAENRIEEGGSWNIRGNILQLAGELNKETYKIHAAELQEKLKDKSFLSDYYRQLMIIRSRYEAEIKQLGLKGVRLMEQAALAPEDSSRGWMKFFGQVARMEIPKSLTTARNMAEAPDKWVAKKAPAEVKAACNEAIALGLPECLSAIVDRLENCQEYNTAGIIAKQFHALGILVDIDRKMAEYAKEKNLLLISDTTELLSKIIGDSDIPFIYEKVGTRIHHYMIDEFQDTSDMQWRNFSPLVHDSLASGQKNLIVGDVKQSIYRWRNSDSSLLGRQLEAEMPPAQTRVEVLPTNWRSCPLIVGFNNTFFTRAASLLEETYNLKAAPQTDHRLTESYKDLYQQPSPSPRANDGHVRVCLIEKSKETDWKADALDRMIKQLKEVQDRGYGPGDIGILARTKAEGNMIAERLLQAKEEATDEDQKYSFDFISDEALFIAGSPSVGVITACLSYLCNPDEALLQLILGDKLTPERLQKLEELKSEPLFDLCENLVHLFQLSDNREEGVYLQAFQDSMLGFLRTNPPDLSLFMEWWKQSGTKKTIAAPSEQRAIQILTIHKSKGLEYPIVMIPLCEWPMDHRATQFNILWCRPDRKPFDEMPMVPVRYNATLLNSHFAADYLDELMKAHTDNLNLAYVAFTRAREELILIVPNEEKVKEINSIAKLLIASLESSAPLSDENEGRTFLPLSEYWNEAHDEWLLGEAGTCPPSGEKPIPLLLEPYRVEPQNDRLKLRLRSKGFFHDRMERVYGNLMHDILSRTLTRADLSRSVDTAFYNGEIDEEGRTKLLQKLEELLTRTPEARRWFGGEYRVLNEVEILRPDGQILRPDRVMRNRKEIVVVDYKFGQIEDPRHQKQVRRYLRQIAEMGYGLPLRGFLWYIELDKMEEVTIN